MRKVIENKIQKSEVMTVNFWGGCGNHPTPTENLGACPECGESVIIEAGEEYICRNFGRINCKPCDFVFPKYKLRKYGVPEITPSALKVLLEGEVLHLEDLRNRDGFRFDCGVVLNWSHQWGWHTRFVNIIERIVTETRRCSGSAGSEMPQGR